MFDPSKYKSYRYHCVNVYIDEKATISEIKDACPMFFSNSRKGEKRTMYRGHLIVYKPFTPSVGPTTRYLAVYAWDVRTKDTHCISTNVDDLSDAKALIRKKLDTPEENPLTLTFADETYNIPVSVKVAVFRNPDGTVADLRIEEWVKIGQRDDRQYHDRDTKELDITGTLFSAVSDRVSESLAKTVAT